MARKIPEDKFAEIYALYASGMAMSDIYKKVKDDWQIDVSERALYALVKQLREVKQAQLSELIGADAADALGKYRWLQGMLEEMAISNRAKSDLFLKIADRLTHMYEFQMSFTQSLPGVKSTSDNGREELIKELASHLVNNVPAQTS